MGEEKNYALAEPGGSATVLNINGEVNLFGSFTNIVATKSDTYGMINDEPVLITPVEKEGNWWGNLLTGIAVTAVFAGLAIATVVTGGAALVAVGLAGAAVGTAVVTAGASIADAKNGHTRTWGKFVGELVMGGFTGAVAGAMVYGLWAAIPAASQAIGLQAGMLFGTSTFTASTIPGIATVGGYALMGTNTLIGLNEINQIGTGRNYMVDYFFNGAQESYDDFVIVNTMLTMGYAELARTNPGLGANEKKEEISPERAKQKEIIDDVESGKTEPKGILQKGNYGEMKADDCFESQGYTRQSKSRVTSLDASSHRGIDGVYCKEGPPKQYVVTEVKYSTRAGEPRLNSTQNGRQMSNSWLFSKDRLLNDVGEEVFNDMLKVGFERKLIKVDQFGGITIYDLNMEGLIIK